MGGGVVSRAHGLLGRGGMVPWGEKCTQPQESRVPCLTRRVISPSQEGDL